MAMRRRIKVGVNLTAAKRKPKTDSNENVKQEADNKPALEKIKAEAPQNEHTETLPSVQDELPSKMIPKSEPTVNTNLNDAAFKCPPRVEFNRSNSYTTTHAFDELNQTDIDNGAQVMQMDLQRTANGFPMSPSKTQRQRIKATPIFGQRRNSLAGPPPSPQPLPADDATEPAASPQRRERHYSGSQNHVPTINHAASKPPSHGTGRIRTESTCSVFSDSHMSTTSKSRKVDDHSTHRTHTRRDFEARFSNGVPDKSHLKMFDLIYYNPASNPMEQKPKIEEIKTETKEEPASIEVEMKNNDNSSVPVPQLKLNAKGELILDDKSLEIETTAEQEARKVLAKSSLIYLDENTGMNGFYKRQKRTRDWPPEETIRFYRCLQTIGTDFSMMCQLFPKRTRRDLKLKFKKEERCNGALINKALLHPNSFNIQELKDQFETEDRQREEEERTKAAYKSIQYKKVNIKTSKAARALKNADDIYNQELRDVEAKKKKKPRKEKNANKNESLEGEDKEKTKKKRQSKKSREEKAQGGKSDIDMESSPKPAVKDEPLYITDQQHEALRSKETMAQHKNSQAQIHESMITPDEPPSEETEYVELLSVDESEYDTNRFVYMEDNDVIPEEFEYMDEIDEVDSRTFVNMDSGNVTLIGETRYNMEDDQNVRHINHNELISNDIGKISNMSTNETLSLPFIGDTEMLYANEVAHPSASYNEDIASKETETSNESFSAAMSNSELDDKQNEHEEQEIIRILEDIANGSLVVVSSFNPASPDDKINEVYMLDPITGNLCEEPLDLPKDLIESILSVMT